MREKRTKKHGMSNSPLVTVPARLKFVQSRPDRTCKSRNSRGPRHRHGTQVLESAILRALVLELQDSRISPIAKFRIT